VTVDSVVPTEILEPMADVTRRRPWRTDSLRQTYGFDDVSLAPGTETLDPDDVDLSVEFCGLRLSIPILASAMDAVVDPKMCGLLAGFGGVAVLNLEGLQTRFEDPTPVLERIATLPADEVQAALAEAYATPISDDLVARRIEEILATGAPAVVAATPAAARKLGPFCAEHGADAFLVQSQSRRRATSRRATRHSRWPSSRASCPSPSPSGTRPRMTRRSS